MPGQGAYSPGMLELYLQRGVIPSKGILGQIKWCD